MFNPDTRATAPMTQFRYLVSPIASPACDNINRTVTIIATDSLKTAEWHASHNSCAFGAGILDQETGKLDVGFGFGVPCPDFNDDKELPTNSDGA